MPSNDRLAVAVGVFLHCGQPRYDARLVTSLQGRRPTTVLQYTAMPVLLAYELFEALISPISAG